MSNTSWLTRTYVKWYDLDMNNLVPYSASNARKNFYALLKAAGEGSKAFEINLRGVGPVVLMNKEEIEGWFETLDILSNPEETKALKKAVKSKKFVSQKKVLEELGLGYEN